MLGLPARTPEEGVESYAAALERLRDEVGIEPSFQALGIDEAKFVEALPQQAMNAFLDQCAPANPRMPMLTDLQGLMRQAYHGTPTQGLESSHDTATGSGRVRDAQRVDR